jgi:hypothetical protein
VATSANNDFSAGSNTFGSLFATQAMFTVQNTTMMNATNVTLVGKPDGFAFVTSETLTTTNNGAALTNLNAASVSGTFASAIVHSNTLAIDAAHFLYPSNLTAARLLTYTVAGGVTNLGVSAASPINQDGTASTFAQINALGPSISGMFITNNGSGYTNAGNIQASTFNGNGRALTNLSTTNTVGTIASSRIVGMPAAAAANMGFAVDNAGALEKLSTTDNVTMDIGNATIVGAFVGNGSGLTNLNATNIVNTSPIALTNVLNSVAGRNATNQQDFVTLSQLQGSINAGQVFYFNTRSNQAVSGAAANSTNWAYTAVPAVWTNVAATAANGVYVAAFASENSFTSLASGLATVDVWAYQSPGGQGSISAEIYILNLTNNVLEYEFTPAPAFQAVPPSTPTQLSFSVPVTDYTSTTNFRVVCMLKVSESGADPTIRIVSGGAYPSHMQFGVPTSALGAAYLAADQTFTGKNKFPQVDYSTNANTAVSPDMNVSYALLSTNAAFAMLMPANWDSTQTKVQTSVLMVTNTTAAMVVITAPGAPVKATGTWNVTNVSAISTTIYPKCVTNMICLPIF